MARRMHETQADIEWAQRLITMRHSAAAPNGIKWRDPSTKAVALGRQPFATVTVFVERPPLPRHPPMCAAQMNGTTSTPIAAA